MAGVSDGSRFHKSLTKHIGEAEDYLQIPRDTIGAIATETSDFAFVVKMCSVIEPVCADMILSHVRANNSSKDAEALATVLETQKPTRNIILVHRFGLIDDVTFYFLSTITDLRNRYAHHIKNVNYSLREIAAVVAANSIDDKTPPDRMPALLNKKIEAILRKLTLIELDDPIDNSDEHNRLLTFYNFYFFLRQALAVLKPHAPRLGDLLPVPLRRSDGR